MRRFLGSGPDDGQGRESPVCDLRLIADEKRSHIWAVFGLRAF